MDANVGHLVGDSVIVEVGQAHGLSAKAMLIDVSRYAYNTLFRSDDSESVCHSYTGKKLM